MNADPYRGEFMITDLQANEIALQMFGRGIARCALMLGHSDITIAMLRDYCRMSGTNELKGFDSAIEEAIHPVGAA